LNLFVFGLGYTALHLIRAHAPRFASVAGTVRSEEKLESLRKQGIAARRVAPDGADPEIAADLARSDAVLVSVPPEAKGDPVLRRFGAALAGSPRIASVLYLSTTGVYGDHRGAWIDETTPVHPINPRSRERVAAEEAWLALGRETGKAVRIFRLSGIYGPGRNALATLAAGGAKRVVKPGQVFNRIHVADIAGALLAALDRSRAGAIYNLADDEPAPPQDVLAFAAALAGVEPPPAVPFEEAALSPMAASFYAENKRVRNRLIKDELGVRLRFPTFREGLRGLREAGEGP
jgi:nucleoside-diphosphate-sugar epimerase